MNISCKTREKISQNIRASSYLSGKPKRTNAQWKKIQKAAQLLNNII